MIAKISPGIVKFGPHVTVNEAKSMIDIALDIETIPVNTLKNEKAAEVNSVAGIRVWGFAKTPMSGGDERLGGLLAGNPQPYY